MNDKLNFNPGRLLLDDVLKPLSQGVVDSLFSAVRISYPLWRSTGTSWPGNDQLTYRSQLMQCNFLRNRPIKHTMLRLKQTECVKGCQLKSGRTSWKLKSTKLTAPLPRHRIMIPSFQQSAIDTYSSFSSETSRTLECTVLTYAWVETFLDRHSEELTVATIHTQEDPRLEIPHEFFT
jgi:hypothetical protein